MVDQAQCMGEVAKAWMTQPPRTESSLSASSVGGCISSSPPLAAKSTTPHEKSRTSPSDPKRRAMSRATTTKNEEHGVAGL